MEVYTELSLRKVETRVLLPEVIRQKNYSEELKEDYCGWSVMRKGEEEHEIKFEKKTRIISCRGLVGHGKELELVLQ